LSNYIAIADDSDVMEGQMLCATLGDERRVLVARVQGVLYALGDACSHRGAPLSDGVLEGCAVVCPWHYARFDVRTGEALGPPASRGVPVFPVRVLNGRIEVALPSEHIHKDCG
jgi:3-phenylpropionate/trans-cinnamate dioxygenase ferredoxin component